MNIFSNVAGKKTRKNKFDKSHERKMSLNMGELIPMYLDEIVPGDNFRVNSEIFIRMAPMLAPIMHRVNVSTHFFFVPSRILWDNFEDFITGGKDGDSLPQHPYLLYAESGRQYFQKGFLSDYLGIPTSNDLPVITQSKAINALPFRAYQMIYNEYYRDQNLQNEIPFSTDDGLDDPNNLVYLRNRAWEKDYFTSALPWAQRGGEAKVPQTPSGQSQFWDALNDQAYDPGVIKNIQSSGTGGLIDEDNLTLGIDPNTNITVNDLRKSVRLQEWLERQARGGARYVETILSHFGVRGSDARMMRPEYLGGGINPVVISETLQTSGTAGETGYTPTPLGQMAGHGIAVGTNHGFKKSFNEFGYVMGIMSVMPKTAYQDGIHRMWSRADKFDYYWPEFAQLGEQEIKNNEVFFDGSTDAGTTWGYQSRYSEMKYGCSSVHGDFRDNLDYWHMGRKFSGLPALNSDFIKSDPTHRVFAVEDETEDKLYCQVYNKVDALRPMPYFGTPTL